MPIDAHLLSTLGIDHLIEPNRSGVHRRMASAEFIRALHHVLDRERAGAWRSVMKAGGHAASRQLAADLDAKLAARGQPALAALPLEACLALLERHFAVHGWGRLELDLSDAAESALVVARLEHSFFAAALSGVDEFVDAFPAGMLQGFFEYISGQTLGCEEIACTRRGASCCTFVITAPERLAVIIPRLGRDPADTILAKLRG